MCIYYYTIIKIKKKPQAEAMRKGNINFFSVHSNTTRVKKNYIYIIQCAGGMVKRTGDVKIRG